MKVIRTSIVVLKRNRWEGMEDETLGVGRGCKMEWEVKSNDRWAIDVLRCRPWERVAPQMIGVDVKEATRMGRKGWKSRQERTRNVVV